MPYRSVLPKRSNSRLRAGPPHDAAKPDDRAVEDVIGQVQSTGSIEAAARKLALYAKMTGMQRPDQPPQRQTSTSSSASASHGKAIEDLPQAKSEPAKVAASGRAGAFYDPEEEEYQAQYTQARAEDADEAGEEDEYALDDAEDEDMESGVENEESPGEIVHLQEIVEGLWVGDLVAAMDVEGLEERGIKNILSLLRPKLQFTPQFSVFPLEIDDSADTDILTHLPTCVAWIAEALRRRERSLDEAFRNAKEQSPEREVLIQRLPQTNPGGVLVHCQAGMSRSATVTAAYLMVALDLDPEEAVEMIKEKRPVVDPSATFWHQLGLFRGTGGKVTLRDRSTRQFYMERTTQFFMNGQTQVPTTDKMAKYPATPTPSYPPTPSGGHGRRKIRCRSCRRLLAVREHMMDHILEQAPVSRPRTPSNFALPSPRGSVSNGTGKEEEGATSMERRGSAVSDIINPLTGKPGARSRQSSMSTDRPRPPSPGQAILSPGSEGPASPGGVPLPRSSTPGLTLTAMTPVDPSRTVTSPGEAPLVETPGTMSRSSSLDRRKDTMTSPRRRSTLGSSSSNRQFQSADQLAARLPPHLQALRSGGTPQSLPSPVGSSPPSSPEKDTSTGSNRNNPFPVPSNGGSNSGSSGGSGHSSGQNAKTAARRLSMLALTPAMTPSMTPTEGSPKERRGSNAAFGGEIATGGIPILVNPKCSGYFVEPLTWMEPVLKNGDTNGKLVCPNEKCGAKIGNFDWAGVQCGCKEWVTPGFCISRSKVDEVW